MTKGRYDGGIQDSERFYVVSTSTFFTLSSSGLRGHSLKLFKTQYSSNIGKFNFSNRVVEHWNKLTEHVVSSGTVNTFKNCYDQFIRSCRGLLSVYKGFLLPSHLNKIFKWYHVKSHQT